MMPRTSAHLQPQPPPRRQHQLIALPIRRRLDIVDTGPCPPLAITLDISWGKSSLSPQLSDHLQCWQPIHGCQQPDSTLVRSTAAAPATDRPATQLLRGARSACDERRSPPIDSPVASLAHYCTWWTACNRFTVASSRTVRLCGRQQPPRRHRPPPQRADGSRFIGV